MTRGGYRKGAGRKSSSYHHGEPIVHRGITLLESHEKYLRTLHPKLSQALREMIAQHILTAQQAKEIYSKEQ